MTGDNNKQTTITCECTRRPQSLSNPSGPSRTDLPKAAYLPSSIPHRPTDARPTGANSRQRSTNSQQTPFTLPPPLLQLTHAQLSGPADLQAAPSVSLNHDLIPPARRTRGLLTNRRRPTTNRPLRIPTSLPTKCDCLCQPSRALLPGFQPTLTVLSTTGRNSLLPADE